MNKCSDTRMQVEMSKRLGELVSNICRGQASLHCFHDFIEDFVDCLDFLDYFMGVWFPQLGNFLSISSIVPMSFLLELLSYVISYYI